LFFFVFFFGGGEHFIYIRQLLCLLKLCSSSSDLFSTNLLSLFRIVFAHSLYVTSKAVRSFIVSTVVVGSILCTFIYISFPYFKGLHVRFHFYTSTHCFVIWKDIFFFIILKSSRVIVPINSSVPPLYYTMSSFSCFLCLSHFPLFTH